MVASIEGSFNNPAYQITLSGGGVEALSNQTSITAYLPESFNFTLGSEWESLWNSFIAVLGTAGEHIAGALDAANNIAGLFNTRTSITQASTFPVWKGNEPLEFSLPFNFVAVENARLDVVDPMVTLMKLVCPKTNNAFTLEAPGPSFTIENQNIVFKEDKIINLKIGKFIYIRGIIITNVASTIVSKFDINGDPIQAQCDVTMRTSFSPTQQDIMQWFIYKNPNYFQGSQYRDWNTMKAQAMETAKSAAGVVKSMGQSVYKQSAGFLDKA